MEDRIKKIGIFDSGIGGLTVLKSIIDKLWFEEIIYFGDTARVPYGSKDQNTILRFALQALDFFSKFDIDLLVVACNTVSAYALDEMNKTSSFPVVGVIQSGINATMKYSKKSDDILVIGTEATIKSNLYQNYLKSRGFLKTTSIATNLFVSLVEEKVTNKELIESCFNYYFKELNNVKQVNSVILGCTHFPLLLNDLKNYFGEEVKFIHSGDAIVEFLKKRYLVHLKEDLESKITYCASSNIKKLQSIAKEWLN